MNNAINGILGAGAKSFGEHEVNAAEPAQKPSGHRSPPKGYPKDASQYADPKNFRYPVDTDEHTRAAWSYIHQPDNQSDYSPAELKFVLGRIRTAAKKFGIQLSE